MTIQTSDIKFYESERMRETNDGGGDLTGIEIESDVTNAVFPQVDRLMRVGGDIEARKVGARVNTDNSDLLKGVHTPIVDPPIDPNISILMFEETAPGDEYADLAEYIENYHQKLGQAGNAPLRSAVEAGSQQLVFTVREKQYQPKYNDKGELKWSSLVDLDFAFGLQVTDLVVLPGSLKEEEKENDERVHIERIEFKTQRLGKPGSKSEYILKMALVTLASPLQHSHPKGVIPFLTARNQGWRAYGAIALAQAVESGADRLKLKDAGVRLTPVIERISMLEDQPAFGPARIASETVGSVIQQVEQRIRSGWAPTNLSGVYTVELDVDAAIGTLEIWYLSGGKWFVIRDEGTGLLTGAGEGSVTGAIATFTTSEAADVETLLLMRYAERIPYREASGLTGVLGSYTTTEAPIPGMFTEAEGESGSLVMAKNTNEVGMPLVVPEGHTGNAVSWNLPYAENKPHRNTVQILRSAEDPVTGDPVTEVVAEDDGNMQLIAIGSEENVGGLSNFSEKLTLQKSFIENHDELFASYVTGGLFQRPGSYNSAMSYTREISSNRIQISGIVGDPDYTEDIRITLKQEKTDQVQVTNLLGTQETIDVSGTLQCVLPFKWELGQWSAKYPEVTPSGTVRGQDSTMKWHTLTVSGSAVSAGGVTLRQVEPDVLELSRHTFDNAYATKIELLVKYIRLNQFRVGAGSKANSVSPATWSPDTHHIEPESVVVEQEIAGVWTEVLRDTPEAAGENWLADQPERQGQLAAVEGQTPPVWGTVAYFDNGNPRVTLLDSGIVEQETFRVRATLQNSLMKPVFSAPINLGESPVAQGMTEILYQAEGSDRTWTARETDGELVLKEEKPFAYQDDEGVGPEWNQITHNRLCCDASGFKLFQLAKTGQFRVLASVDGGEWEEEYSGAGESFSGNPVLAAAHDESGTWFVYANSYAFQKQGANSWAKGPKYNKIPHIEELAFSTDSIGVMWILFMEGRLCFVRWSSGSNYTFSNIAIAYNSNTFMCLRPNRNGVILLRDEGVHRVSRSGGPVELHAAMGTFVASAVVRRFGSGSFGLLSDGRIVAIDSDENVSVLEQVLPIAGESVFGMASNTSGTIVVLTSNHIHGVVEGVLVSMELEVPCTGGDISILGNRVTVLQVDNVGQGKVTTYEINPALAAGGLEMLDPAGNIITKVGTFDPLTGTGVINNGLPPKNAIASCMVENPVTTSAVHTYGAAPIIPGTFRMTARAKADGTLLELVESGNILTGAGSGSYNRVKGYAIATWDRPIDPASVTIDYAYKAIFRTQFEKLDVGALPMDGKVPVMAPNDIVRIGERTRYQLIAPVAEDGDTITLIPGPMPSDIVGRKLNIEGEIVSVTEEVEQTNTMVLMQGIEPVTLRITRAVDGTTAAAHDTSRFVELLDPVSELVPVSEVLGEDILLANNLTHNYSAGASCSSVIRHGDVQSREMGWFTQGAWTNEWFKNEEARDSAGLGAAADTYNFTDHPLVLTNSGAIKERWSIKVTSTSPLKGEVRGERVGVILTDADLTADLALVNPQMTGKTFFRLAAAGWGGGWQVGNVLRFDTVGTEMRWWMIRATNAGASDQQDDSARFGVHGDAGEVVTG